VQAAADIVVAVGQQQLLRPADLGDDRIAAGSPP
jgi:hypothetical protein